jgi:hypothetical protein
MNFLWQVNYLKKIFLISLLGLILVLSGCTGNSPKASSPTGIIGETAKSSIGSGTVSTASWVYQFVRYNNVPYLPTKDTVSKIKSVIGQINYYSLHERDDANKNFFSNCYKKGLVLYSIKGVNAQDAIAVKVSENKYVKLVNIKNTSLKNLA